MAIKTHLNVAAAWKEAKRVYVNVSGTWKNVNKIWANVVGTWKQVFGARVIPTNSIILFIGGTTPAGWTDISSTFNNQFFMGAGSTYGYNIIGGADSIDLSGTTTSVGHASIINAYEGHAWFGGANLGINRPQKRGTEFLSGGTHTHTYSNSTFFTNPLYTRFKVLQATEDAFSIPVGGIILSNVALDTSEGLTNTSEGVGRFPRGFTAYGGTGGVDETSGTAVITSTTNGSHGHHANDPTDPGEDSYTSIDAATPAWGGDHSHQVTVTYNREIKRQRLTPWKTAISSPIVTNAIIMWNTATPPTGYVMCDGTNGTPDMRDYILELSVIGSVGSTAASLSATYLTDTDGAHHHMGPLHPVNTAGDTYDHWHETVLNDHTHTGNTTITGDNPAFKGIYFIMKEA